MDGIAMVAKIKVDGTWDKMHVPTGGANWDECVYNAIYHTRQILEATLEDGYPETIIGLAVTCRHL